MSSDHASSLDEFAESVVSKDTNVRLDVYARLEDYLRNEHARMHCSDLSKFCEGILAWVNCSNMRVCINGLTIIQLLIQRFTEPLRNYATESKFSLFYM